MALDTNIVSYFKLDDSLTDELGKYTMTGGSSYIAGKINNTRDGEPEIATIATAANFVGTGSWTGSFWFKFTTAGGYFWNVRVTGNDWAIDDGNAVGKVRFLWWDTGGNLDGVLETTSTYNDGNWHFCVFGFDNSAQKIYLQIDNGTTLEDAVTGTTRITNNCTFRFADDLAGDVDEIAMWTGEWLSSTDRTTLYNGGTGLQYPFTSTNIKSISGNTRANVKSLSGNLSSNIKSISGNA